MLLEGRSLDAVEAMEELKNENFNANISARMRGCPAYGILRA